jgi:hypothetical protein
MLKEKDEEIKRLKDKLIEKDEEISKIKTFTNCFENLREKGEYTIIEEEIPFVKQGGSIISEGWILLKKKLLSNLNWETNSIVKHLKMICSCLSLKENDLFVYYSENILREKEISLWNGKTFLKSKKKKIFHLIFIYQTLK